MNALKVQKRPKDVDYSIKRIMEIARNSREPRNQFMLPITDVEIAAGSVLSLPRRRELPTEIVLHFTSHNFIYQPLHYLAAFTVTNEGAEAYRHFGKLDKSVLPEALEHYIDKQVSEFGEDFQNITTGKSLLRGIPTYTSRNWAQDALRNLYYANIEREEKNLIKRFVGRFAEIAAMVFIFNEGDNIASNPFHNHYKTRQHIPAKGQAEFLEQDVKILTKQGYSDEQIQLLAQSRKVQLTDQRNKTEH